MSKVVEIDRVVNEIARFKGYLDDDMIYRLQLATKRLPTVDAEPVKHGWWIGKEDQRWHCSECDGIAPKGYRYNYCPNCGAKMGGEGRKDE